MYVLYIIYLLSSTYSTVYNFLSLLTFLYTLKLKLKNVTPYITRADEF